MRFPINIVFTHKVFLFIVFVLFFISCKKDKEKEKEKIDPEPAAAFQGGPGVYISGTSTSSDIFTATVWKDGIKMYLEGAYARNIASSNGDLYVAGDVVIPNTGHFLPAYWKNGVKISLPLPAGITYGNTWGIWAFGNDTYISGSSFWKNGAIIPSPVDYSISSMFIKGTNVFYAGNYQITQPNGAFDIRGIFTVNNLPVKPGLCYSVSDMAVIGTNIYVDGIADDPSNAVDFLAGAVWKNGGIPNTYLGTNAAPQGMFVKGTDLYIAGWVVYYSESKRRFMAVYWKNGIMTKLSPDLTDHDFEPEGICVDNDNNVYVCVNEFENTPLGRVNYAGYYKNGVYTRLSKFPASVTGITVINK